MGSDRWGRARSPAGRPVLCEASLRSLPRRLGPVPGPSLPAVLDPRGVERAPHDLVAHAREVLHAPAAYEHDGVFLKVVADSRNVGGDFDSGGQPDAGDLSERGVRLLGRGRVDAGADTAALRRALERWALRLRPRALTPVSDQLLHSWHASLVFN